MITPRTHQAHLASALRSRQRGFPRLVHLGLSWGMIVCLGMSTPLVALGASTAASVKPTSPASPARVVYDVLIERPLSFAELVSGVAISSVAYPIALTGGDQNMVIDRCVSMPGRNTFTRKIGHLPKGRRSLCSPVSFGFEFVQLAMGTALMPIGWLFGASPFDRRAGDGEGLEVAVEPADPQSDEEELAL